MGAEAKEGDLKTPPFPERTNHGMDRVLDDLAAALTAPHKPLSERVSDIAIRLAGNALTGLAIGLGIAAGLALAA